MKEIKVLLMLVVVGLAFNVQASEYSPYYDNCMNSSDSDGVSGYGVICYEMEAAIQKARLNRAYLHYINQIDVGSVQGQQLEQNQKKWLKQRNQDCNYVESDERHQSMEVSSCIMEKTAKRAVFLEKLALAIKSKP